MTRSDVLLLLVPGLLWWAGIHARDRVIPHHCIERPESCQAANVFFLDRPVIGIDQPGADWISLQTQNLSGALLLFIPLLLHLSRAGLGRMTWLAALAAFGTDFAIALQTTFWNGLLTETTRLIVQRPRPFVYANLGLGADSANYTAFYSGHTSFAAAACVALLLILISRRAPLWLILFSALAVETLPMLTGVYRVLAGRHFITDVVVGMFMGAMVAVIVAWSHRTPDPSPELR